MTNSINLSDREIRRLDEQITAFQTQRDAIKARGVAQVGTILAELKNSRFEVWGQGIAVRPSPAMKALLPEAGSQDRFSIPLSEEYSLFIDDLRVSLWSERRDDLAARLKWLSQQGVSREQVTLDNQGYGNVSSARFYLEKAIKEEAETQHHINEAFPS